MRDSVRNARLPLAAFLALWGAGCDDAEPANGGDSSGDGGSGDACDGVPDCYAEALADVMDCVTETTLTLGSVRDNSGVVEGLVCTGTDSLVELSTFSTRPTGTVPTPSTVTVSSQGSECFELGTGAGSVTTRDGATRRYESTILRRPDADEVRLQVYEDGTLEVLCGPTMESFEVPSSVATGCPEGVQSLRAFRDDDITVVGIEQVDAAGERGELLRCEADSPDT